MSEFLQLASLSLSYRRMLKAYSLSQKQTGHYITKKVAQEYPSLFRFLLRCTPPHFDLIGHALFTGYALCGILRTSKYLAFQCSYLVCVFSCRE